MHKFDHPNVLKLIGVCLDGGPAPYIIMPFMANGSLLSYLKKERDQLVVDTAAETVSFTSCRKMISSCCMQDEICNYVMFSGVCGEEVAGYVSASGQRNGVSC